MSERLVVGVDGSERSRAALQWAVDEEGLDAGARPGGRCYLILGPAATALVEAAGGADLPVVGARGLAGFMGMLLGSVSQRCVVSATCPVVVVRSPDDG